MEFTIIKELFDIKDDFGFPNEEIERAENRLKIKFPYLLRKYYKELGNHKKLNQTQDSLLDLERVKFEDNEFLIFYVENQYVAIWGIPKNEITKENPSVFRKVDNNEWELDSRNLSSFLTSMALMQSIFALDYHANICGVDDKYDEIVTKNYKVIKEEFSLWNVKFYRNQTTELIAVFKNVGQTDIFITAKNKQDFESITSKFDFQWDYHSEKDS